MRRMNRETLQLRIVDRETASQQGTEEGRLRATCLLCGHSTTGRKPYCLDHLHRLPYVADILARRSSGDTRGY